MYYEEEYSGVDTENEELKSTIIKHYGMPRRSGRYPWGSGENPYQSEKDFLDRIRFLQKQGLSKAEITKTLGLRNSKELDVQVRAAKHVGKLRQIDTIRSMQNHGISNVEIAKKLGLKGESTVRSLMKSDQESKKIRVEKVKDILKTEVDKKKFLDVGKGTSPALGITDGVLDEALFLLAGEGYISVPFSISNVVDSRRKLNTTVLVKESDIFTKEKVEEYRKQYEDPQTADSKLIYASIYENIGDLQPIINYHSNDGGKTFNSVKYPAPIERSRILVRYGEEGGQLKDGTIELREGVKDLSLGDNRYSQLRVLVEDKDGSKGYMKGMGFYSTDIPDGYDVVYNVAYPNKNQSMSAFKKLKLDDPDNPFGATIKAGGQYHYKAADGTKKLSPINKIKEDGDWEDMSKNLSAQFLSKQPPRLVNIQLKETLKDKVNQANNLRKIPSEEIKKQMMLSYADDLDGAITDLKAMSLPRQKTLVLLPLTEGNEKECYAPSLKQGESVALVRYPHGARFEIPIVKVNNNNDQGKRNYGNMQDAIGIHQIVAEQLSGADFDGDQVVAIPLGTETGSMVKAEAMVDAFKDFNHKMLYERNEDSGEKYETSYVYKEMGVISNLITDMTVAGASTDEIVRAIKYSMVVIDSVKPDSQLDLRRAKQDFNIDGLKVKYQGKIDPISGKQRFGASTFISRKGHTTLVPERRGQGIIDPKTGKKEYRQSGREYTVTKVPSGWSILSEDNDKGTVHIVNKDGKVRTIPMEKETKIATQEVRTYSIVGTKESDVKSFFEYSTHRGVEDLYAQYADDLMKVRDNLRKDAVAIKAIPVDKKVTEEYAAEVESLLNKLTKAESMAPAERRAQAIANAEIFDKKERAQLLKAQVIEEALTNSYLDRNFETSKKDMDKIRQRAITKARAIVGINREEFEITPTEREWEAIIRRAIPSTTITNILKYISKDVLREFTDSVNEKHLTVGTLNMAKNRIKAGYTLEEVAESLGISVSTLQRKLKGE